MPGQQWMMLLCTVIISGLELREKGLSVRTYFVVQGVSARPRFVWSLDSLHRIFLHNTLSGTLPC